MFTYSIIAMVLAVWLGPRTVSDVRRRRPDIPLIVVEFVTAVVFALWPIPALIALTRAYLRVVLR